MSSKEKLECLIKEQGDLLRKLKSAKESKEKVRKDIFFHSCIILLYMDIPS